MNAGRNGRKTIRNAAVAIAAVAMLGLAASEGPLSQGSAPQAPAREDVLRRGEYLVTIGVCNDCHTPWIMGENGPEPDMTRMLSGHPQDVVMPPVSQGDPGPWPVLMAATNTAFAGPWGVSFAANLTPDEHTGIGAWTEEIFVNALRTGKHWGQSRPILPPMPWFNYRHMTDEDLHAVFTYLRSIPARSNSVPLPIPPGGSDLTAQNLW